MLFSRAIKIINAFSSHRGIASKNTVQLTSCLLLLFKCIYCIQINDPLHQVNNNLHSRGGVMDSVFAKRSGGCGFETRLVYMPVMLVRNVHPDIIKANHP